MDGWIKALVGMLYTIQHTPPDIAQYIIFIYHTVVVYTTTRTLYATHEYYTHYTVLQCINNNRAHTRHIPHKIIIIFSTRARLFFLLLLRLRSSHIHIRAFCFSFFCTVSPFLKNMSFFSLLLLLLF